MTPIKTTIVAGTSAALLLFGAVVHNFKTLTATVSWAPTPGDTYRLYSGKTPGVYPTQLEAGTTGTYNFLVARGATYYFALTAVRQGIESGKSLEYKYTAPRKP